MTMQSRNYTLGYLVQKNEDRFSSPKNLYANVNHSFIHNSHKLETTQMSFNI